MEDVGSSFTEFFDKVNNISQSLDSSQKEINCLIESNSFITHNLSKLESRLLDGESIKIINGELENQIKPRVDLLVGALEAIRRNLQDALFLDWPTQQPHMTIGQLADETISRFNKLYSEVRHHLEILL